jgi:hypothetical protein
MPYLPHGMKKEAKAIATLSKLALEHDKTCCTSGDHTADCPEHRCLGNRALLVAALMIEMDMSIFEIGHVADALIELEVTADMGELDEKPSDDVLEAKSLEFP